MNELHAVVLTGMGAITARGDATLHGAPCDFARATAASFQIKNLQLEKYLDSQKTYLDRCSTLALAGGALALRDAGIEWPIASDDFGITLGTHLGCLETMQAFWDKAMERGVRLANPLLFSHSYLNSPISLCAIEFGLKGYHTTLCAGGDSGRQAVLTAYDAIRLGHAQAMLCGGVEAATPTRARCENSDNSGEAAAFFVLESEAHATQRGVDKSLEINDDFFSAAIASQEKVSDLFGDCGGASSALAVVLQVQQRDAIV